MSASPKTLNPAPLGLAAFAMTTTVLCLFTVGAIPSSWVSIVIPLAIAYGGLMQVIVGLWEAKMGNTFGFVAFSSYGAFWIYYALVAILSSVGMITVSPTAAGVVLIMWGFLTLYLWIASLKAPKVTCMVFLFLTLTFFVLGIGDITGIGMVSKAGGALGLITAALAWYNSLAIVINDMHGRTAAPLGKPLM
ncbi:MAG: acetate uptake transporter [Candidatus Methanosuratincola sp.]|nr:acetate uptake transporter [Candidatus Methanosuratincola sp.]